jgi:hypothetical protein
MSAFPYSAMGVGFIYPTRHRQIKHVNGRHVGFVLQSLRRQCPLSVPAVRQLPTVSAQKD